MMVGNNFRKLQLLSIVYSMTTFRDWNIPEHNSYNYWNEVKYHFNPYKNHSAVQDAQKL